MKNNTKFIKKPNIIKEGCDCEKEGLVKKIKKKYMKEHVFQNVVHYDPKNLSETTKFNNTDLERFLGKEVLAETTTETVIGVLKMFKGNFVVENKNNKRALDIQKLTKFVCENTKIKRVPETDILSETILPSDNITEDSKIYIKDHIKNKFFVKEEIVNADNKGKLSSDRQKSRDKIASKLKNVKVVKGPPGRMDTPEEAKYRLATFIELNTKKKKSDK